MAQKVGYIGLGYAGWPLAANLFKGDFDIYVSDADYTRAQEFAKKHGCNAVKAGSDGFKDVDVLITMLPNGDIVRDVLFGKQGIVHSLKKGTVVADMSTADAFNSIELAKDLEPFGIDYLDAPITQRKNHETDVGKVTVMIGGNSDAAVEKALPALKTMAKYHFRMGKVGAGHAMKAMNNYILAASICALADSFTVGAKFGLDPGTMLDVLNVGSGRAYATEVNIRDEGLTRRYDSGFQMYLLVKDLAINKHMVEKMGLDSPLPRTVHGLLKDAMDEVGPSVCHTQLLKAWEKWGNVEIKKTPQPPAEYAPLPWD